MMLVPALCTRMRPPIIPDSRTSIPAFCSDAANYDSALSTRLSTYSLRAIIVHLGDVPHLWPLQSHSIHELKPRHRFCDDAKSPAYHDAVPELVHRFGYVYLYQHD